MSDREWYDEGMQLLATYGQICIAAGTLTDEDMTAPLDEASRAVISHFTEGRCPACGGRVIFLPKHLDNGRGCEDCDYTEVDYNERDRDGVS